MDHLSASERVVGRILAKLAESGLRRVDLGYETVGLDEALKPYFEDSIRWLREEGIIRYVSELGGTEPGEIYYLDAVLTAKGFELLSQGVSLGGEVRTLGTAVRDVSEGRSYSSLGDFFGGLLGGLTKSLGS